MLNLYLGPSRQVLGSPNGTVRVSPFFRELGINVLLDLMVGEMNGGGCNQEGNDPNRFYQILGELQNQPTSRSDAASSRSSVRHSEGSGGNCEHDVWTW